MSVEADRPLPGAAACPCRHGDVAAEVARQRPLLERAALGDRQAFGSLFDEQVEGVYRYLLAWTGDRAAAEELTGQVFHAALARPPVTVGTAPPAEAAAGAPRTDTGDVGAWLVAMARDAVVRWRGTGRTAGPAERPSPADPLEAVALLGDPERDVVVLRLLLGHSLAHTAHLSGYGQPTVVQLQLTACLAIRSMTGGWSGGPLDPDPQDPAGTTPRALELDRHLDRWDTEVAGDDHELADALAVAASLRLVAPAHVVAPAYLFVERLRAQLLAAELPGGGQGQGVPPNAADDGRDPVAPRRAAGGGLRDRAGRAVAAARVEVSRRPKPWVATAVAASLIVVILSLQALGSPRPRSPCRGASCPQTTVRAAPASATAAPLTSVRRRSTTTTPSTLPAPTTVAAPAPTTPPTTTPATTAPRTTRPPRTTTTRRPATTAATTTSSTTTTAPPTST